MEEENVLMALGLCFLRSPVDRGGTLLHYSLRRTVWSSLETGGHKSSDPFFLTNTLLKTGLTFQLAQETAPVRRQIQRDSEPQNRPRPVGRFPQRWKRTGKTELHTSVALTAKNEGPEGPRDVARKRGAPSQLPLVKVVKQGDYLYRLTKEAYGFANDDLVRWVAEHNPNIKNQTSGNR